VIYILIILGWTFLFAAAWWIYRRWETKSRSRARLEREPAEETESPPARGQDFDVQPHPLRRWLSLAGFRRGGAARLFVLATIAGTAAGLLCAYAFFATGLRDQMVRAILVVPGGIGEIFAPVIIIAPWFFLLLLALLPALVVRRTRRARVEQIEQDLPPTLELLATLSEAGIGFDAAIARIQSTRLGQRPLAQEFRTFQADLLAGRARSQSLRRLAERIQVASVSVLVSALVQAEQLGMGIAQTLRRQADDLRDRRRERANAFAMALPVKRLFPLVICFLPGLFVWTLGPFFVQLFQIADSLVRVRGF